MRDVAPLRCWRGKTDEATCFLGKHGSLLLSFCAKMLDCFHNIHWSLIGSAKRFAEVRESPVALSSLIFHGKHGKIAQLQLRQRLAHTDGSSRLLVNGFFSWHVPRSPAGGRCDVSRGLETTTKDCVLQNGTLSVSPPLPSLGSSAHSLFLRDIFIPLSFHVSSACHDLCWDPTSPLSCFFLQNSAT